MTGQRIIPYLYYEDGVAAMDYLTQSLGFEELQRVFREDGSFMHGEVGYQDNRVMLGTPVDEDGNARKLHGTWRTCCVMCLVDDVDAHYERAKKAGANITGEPEDRPYGDRVYSVSDPEGHDWFFTTSK